MWKIKLDVQEKQSNGRHDQKRHGEGWGDNVVELDGSGVCAAL